MSDTQNSETETKPTSWRDKTLKAAGYSYIAGDIAGVAASVARKEFMADWQTAGGFGVWAAGGLAAARYGNPNAEKQVEILSHKLERHLAKQGIAIPQDAREQSELLKNHGVWHGIESFLYEHPSEVLNVAYALGAGLMLHQGVVAFRKGDNDLLPKAFTKEAFAKVSTDFWSGALVLPGAIGGLLIKEDPQAQEKAKNGNFIDKTKAYFTEKSLRFPGLMYGLNNVVLAGRVLQQRDKFGGTSQLLKPHHFSMVTLGTYIFSNLMLQFSSRNQIAQHLPAQEVAKLEQAGAAIIAYQSPEAQQALLGSVSTFLAAQKGVGMDAAQIAQHLAARVTELTGRRMQAAAEDVKSFANNELGRREETASAALTSTNQK